MWLESFTCWTTSRYQKACQKLTWWNSTSPLQTRIVFGLYNSNVFHRKFKYISKDNRFNFTNNSKRVHELLLDCIWIINSQKKVSSSNAFQKHISKVIHEMLLDYMIWIALEMRLSRISHYVLKIVQILLNLNIR